MSEEWNPWERLADEMGPSWEEIDINLIDALRASIQRDEDIMRDEVDQLTEEQLCAGRANVEQMQVMLESLEQIESCPTLFGLIKRKVGS